MQANSFYHSHPYGNSELYQKIFKVLDQLGMADLKQTFQEHCIQDQTLSFVETEEELKQLLKEIGIPIGRCIPIIKLWSKGYTYQEQVTHQARVQTAEKSFQVTVETSDACTQTDDDMPVLTNEDYSKLISEMNLNSQQEIFNHYAAQLAGGHNETHSGSLNSPYSAQQVDPYLTAQMWGLGQYQDYAANMYGAFLQAPVTSIPAGMVVSEAVASQAAIMFNQEAGDANHVAKPTPAPHVPSHNPTQHRRTSASLPSSPKDIVDEREDLEIEQSLKDFENMELETQHSYASALNSDSAGLSQESQHSYSSITEHPPYYSLSSQRIQTTSNSHPLPRHPPPARSVPLEKTEPSQFSKCDDISVQSGVARLSSSPQIVGPQTLQGYLDSLPETPEYKQAMQSRNPKKGWKPLDGKHITTGKKVAFKPIFWDNEGRMRHGVRVRGSDKSEECWRHVEGKAPAGCTFAHSRLGDTLQFICVKCTYEKGRNEWCSDKMKHKQYIFNLGAYRNLEGGIWKKTS
ncbi:unnamed protein product [Porites lobata]|uniref:Uncharacterized protein n=1 Tax=Porites lobata TaxID=104759 RepID=A0ABN8MZI7_9CNID|nr:unnamed protein product [Porites lobata]